MWSLPILRSFYGAPPILNQSEKIRTILPRQEQGGGFMAHGYARATGKAGVCMATSGLERLI